MPQGSKIGVIRTTRTGFGFIRIEDFDDDIRIDEEHLNTALDGDTVSFTLLRKKHEERPHGKVEKVLERARTRFVGVLDIGDGKVFLIPDNNKIYTDIFIPKPTADCKKGAKALIALDQWDDPKHNPTGTIVKVLGMKGDHETEIQSIIIEKGIEADFPSPVSAQADAVADDWFENGTNYIEEAVQSDERRDFRNAMTFTIDPADAKDFDDALSYRELPSGNMEVGIHIADVSFYVKPNSQLDKEARERGFSVYLVDRTIPMLPPVLSNDICSLNPNTDRLAYSAVFTLDKEARVIDRWFGRSVIHSNNRFSYEEAQEVISKGSGTCAHELLSLNSLAGHLRKRKFEGGAIEFESDEYKIELDENNVPIAITKKERLDTHKLIEDFMLLANREVATYIYRAHGKKNLERAFIYRVHDRPNIDKIRELSHFLKALGYSFRIKGDAIEASDLNRLFDEVGGKPEENLVRTAAIRAMAKAAYSTKNIGHFGLGFGFYTHFTSPIRRYSDLLVHRLLESHRRGHHISEDEFESYKSIAERLTNREISIQQAERDSIAYKQIEYMSTQVGKEFDGIINGVTNFGIFVADMGSGAEGLIRAKELPGDYYEFNEKKYEMKGKRSKKKYALGDHVRVRVKSFDLDRKTLDYEIV